MAMIVLSSPATLTRSEEKKTGPSRFRPLYSGGWVDPNFTDWHELFRSQELGVGIKKSGNRMNGFRFQVSGKKVQGSGGTCQVPSFRFRGYLPRWGKADGGLEK